MNTSSLPLAAANTAIAAQRRAQSSEPPQPWWRVPMVWVVLSGPLAVIVASLVTAVVAWKHIDPVIDESKPGQVHIPVTAEVPVPADPKDSMAPAMKGRNHAATPLK